MLMRTGTGVLWQSYSADRGRTWTEPAATTIANPGSRFFIRRLVSGNLLLVNHYKFKGRSHLTARLSTDDGETWNGVQSADGLITVVYDRDRAGAGEILLASFREQDVIAGKNVSGDVRLKQAASESGRLEDAESGVGSKGRRGQGDERPD